jgi:glycosyltransferase involved in cell wall biosynthesis
MIPVYNEADIVGQVIEHLASQGIKLVVLDNGSTDGSFEIIKNYVGKEVLSVQRMVTEKFELRLMLRRLYAMATEQNPDWILLSGADEFLESPYRSFTLNKAIQIEAERGFNLIQFNNFEFYPTENDFASQETDVRRRLRYYSWNDDAQFRCWKMYPSVSVFETIGHDAELPDGTPAHVSPNKFVLRHYKIRSYEHGLRKIFHDRLPRFSPEERAKGWHVEYDNFGTHRDYFVIDSSKLTHYDEDGNWNLAKTFDGYFGAWNSPSASEKIAKLQNDIMILNSSLSLRLARRVPFGARIRKLLVPKK